MIPPTRRTTQRRSGERAIVRASPKNTSRGSTGSTTHSRNGSIHVRCGSPAAIQPPAGPPVGAAGRCSRPRDARSGTRAAAPSTRHSPQQARYATPARGEADPMRPGGQLRDAGRIRLGRPGHVVRPPGRGRGGPGRSSSQVSRRCEAARMAGRIDGPRVERLDRRPRSASKRAVSRRASSSSSREPSAGSTPSQSSPSELAGARRRQDARRHPAAEVQLLGAGQRERHDRRAGAQGDQRRAVAERPDAARRAR